MATDTARFLCRLARALGTVQASADKQGCPRCCRLVSVDSGRLRTHGRRGKVCGGSWELLEAGR
jgi:hypothetical protein